MVELFFATVTFQGSRSLAEFLSLCLIGFWFGHIMPTDDEDAPPYHYIAFIDEAGDPGIQNVRPASDPGASEWLVIGGVLVKAANERAPVEWVRSSLAKASSRQRALHFRDLKEWQKPIVCGDLASRPVKLFALLSNKKNMQGHTNERAAAKGNPLTMKQVFYNYCLRLILERITDFCLHHSMACYGAPRYVKIIFSKRGGHSYGHTIAYNEVLRAQARSETTFLQKREVRWQVIHRLLQEARPHEELAGLQLADVVASSFFQAVDILPPTQWNPGNAKLLKPRMARECGFIQDYGVALQPTPYRRAKLLSQQKQIFAFYEFDMREF